MKVLKRRAALPLWSVLALLAALVVFMVFGAFRRAKSRADTATENARQADRLATQIVRFRNRPRQASLVAEPPSRTAERITAAANAAGIKLDSVRTLDPQSPNRVGRSDYVIRASTITVEDVTLGQMAAFCESLAERGDGLIVRDIGLTARPMTGSGDSLQERWDVRLTLTQLIHSPISP